ncbi:MAG: hypothetical protein ACJATA_000685 [Sphingobacteriales bacterium]|jgi:hypothetical protein
MKKVFAISLITLLITITAVPLTSAQCPMCKSAVESSMSDPDNNVGMGLNTGILYLLATPYLLVGAVGFMWWKKLKKKEQDVEGTSIES